MGQSKGSPSSNNQKSAEYLHGDFLWKNSDAIGYVRPMYKRKPVKVIKYKRVPVRQISREAVSSCKPKDIHMKPSSVAFPKSSKTPLSQSHSTSKDDSEKPSKKLSKFNPFCGLCCSNFETDCRR